MPSLEEICYIAGLFDGEGHVTVTRNRANAREYLTVGCGVANSERTVLDWLKKLFDGNVYCVNPETGQRKAGYSWIARSSQMTTFLKTVLPYLRIKRRQAELGIKFQEGMGTRYGNRVTTGEAERRETIRLELRSLNAKSRFV